MCNFLQPRLCWKRSSQGFKTWFQKSLGDIIYIATSSVTVGPVQNLLEPLSYLSLGGRGTRLSRDAQTPSPRPTPPALPGAHKGVINPAKTYISPADPGSAPELHFGRKSLERLTQEVP